MIRTILTYPNPELKKKSAPVTIITESTRELARDMAETMYNAPGIGLAAPQIGVHQRIIVIDVSGSDERPELIIALNPVIVHAEGETYGEVIDNTREVIEAHLELRKKHKELVSFVKIKNMSDMNIQIPVPVRN